MLGIGGREAMTFRAGAIFSRPPVAIRPIGARAALHQMTPQACDWFKAIPADQDALGNDKYSNCYPIARRWVIALRRANMAGDSTRPSLQAVLSDYTFDTGFNQLTGTPDVGTDTAVGMGNWCRLGVRVNDQTLDVPHWLTVDPTNVEHLSIALWCAGPLMATWNLCMALQDPANWSVAPGTSSDWTTPWAGHETVLGASDGNGEFTTRTWGLDLPIHSEVLRQYCRQVDVPLDLSPGGWLDTTGRTPSGLDRVALAGDMSDVAIA